MRILFILFVILPIAEIAVLVQVGSVIGTLNTVGLVVLTAIVGAFLLRRQGESALGRARLKMREGTLPAEEMVEGLFLAVGGALLLTPGFITDAVGLCCLVPGVRKSLILWGYKHLTLHTVVSTGEAHRPNDRPAGDRHTQSNNTIEGEYKRED